MLSRHGKRLQSIQRLTVLCSKTEHSYQTTRLRTLLPSESHLLNMHWIAQYYLWSRWRTTITRTSTSFSLLFSPLLFLQTSPRAIHFLRLRGGKPLRSPRRVGYPYTVHYWLLARWVVTSVRFLPAEYSEPGEEGVGTCGSPHIPFGHTMDLYLHTRTSIATLWRKLLSPKAGGQHKPDTKLKCCFTFTETVGLLGTGAQNVHLHFHTASELCRTQSARATM